MSNVFLCRFFKLLLRGLYINIPALFCMRIQNEFCFSWYFRECLREMSDFKCQKTWDYLCFKLMLPQKDWQKNGKRIFFGQIYMKSFGSNSLVIAVAQIKGKSVCASFFACVFFRHSTPIWALKWLFKNQVSLFRCLVSKRRLAGVFVFVCRPKRCCARCQFGIRRAAESLRRAQRKGRQKKPATTAVFSFQVRSPCFWTGILWARTKKMAFLSNSCSYHTFSSKAKPFSGNLCIFVCSWNSRAASHYQIIWLLCK